MKKYMIPLVILLFAGEIHAWPSWIPRPSRVWNSVVNGASDLWDNVEDFLVDPILNLGQDSFDLLIGKLGLAPDVQAMLTGIIRTHIKEPWGFSPRQPTTRTLPPNFWSFQIRPHMKSYFRIPNIFPSLTSQARVTNPFLPWAITTARMP